jgi:hypothetical protein
MQIIGTHIAIPWDYCKPFCYGKYDGKLKKGNRPCTIDVDWKIKVFNELNEQVGTDEISYWLCDSNHVRSIIDSLEDR